MLFACLLDYMDSVECRLQVTGLFPLGYNGIHVDLIFTMSMIHEDLGLDLQTRSLFSGPKLHSWTPTYANKGISGPTIGLPSIAEDDQDVERFSRNRGKN